jgi:hypothetical protein
VEGETDGKRGDGGEDVAIAEEEGFGLVYLDYCCRLSTGAFSLEKSPTQDIKALFRLGYYSGVTLVLHLCCIGVTAVLQCYRCVTVLLQCPRHKISRPCFDSGTLYCFQSFSASALFYFLFLIFPSGTLLYI